MPSPVTSETIAALIPDGSDQVCDALRGLANVAPVFRDFLAYLLDSSGNPTTTFKNEVATTIVPVGTVLMWAGSSLPEGFILCTGQSLARVGTYANLYAVIGTTYGAVDANSFSVPNTVEKFVLGAGTLGATGGSNTATLVLANVPPHTHELKLLSPIDFGSGSGSMNRVSTTETYASTVSTSSAGGSGSPAAAQSFSVQNPYIALRHIIRY